MEPGLTRTRASSGEQSPGQNHRHRLIVRLNNKAYRTALIELVQSDRKADHHGPLHFPPRLQLVFGSQRRLGVHLQGRKALVVTVEVDCGNCIFRMFAARGHHLSLNATHPKSFPGRTPQAKRKRGEHSVLPRNLHRRYVIQRSGSLGLGALNQRKDARQNQHCARRQQENLYRRQVSLGSSKLVPDVNCGSTLPGWRF